nr:RidA family protein [Williamsia sp. 1135]
MAVRRTAVNPVAWSVEMGFNQGELVSGHSRTLYCSGQTAMNSDGSPAHSDDMGGQLRLSVENLVAVLGEAGMSLSNLLRLNVSPPMSTYCSNTTASWRRDWAPPAWRRPPRCSA